MADSEAGDELLRAVGARVRELRLKAGLTQPEVARAAGVKKEFIWRIEDGRQNIGLRTMSRLSLALGVPMSALLLGIEADPKSLGARSYRKQ